VEEKKQEKAQKRAYKYREFAHNLYYTEIPVRKIKHGLKG